MESLSFDLELRYVPVELKGHKEKYVLLEASEEAACKFENIKLNATRFDVEGRPNGFVGMADAATALVAKCLFVAGPDGAPVYDQHGHPKGAVAESFVKGLPSRVTKVLYDKVLEISDMKVKKTVVQIDKEIAQLYKLRNELTAAEKTAEEALPNPQPATESTSS